MYQNWCLQDYGVPIPRAATISGIERGAFTILLARGILGPAPAHAVPSASLLHVAAAMALTDADRAGIQRETLTPILTQIADAAYLRLAMLELSQRRWHPGDVPASNGTALMEKIRSGEGQSELEEILAIRSRNTKRFAVFQADGPLLTDSLPGTTEPSPHLDAWSIAQRIQVRMSGVLFYAQPWSGSTWN